MTFRLDKTWIKQENVFLHTKNIKKEFVGGVNKTKAISSVNYLENFHKIINVLEVLGIVQTENI